jgi:hypothetical protein
VIEPISRSVLDPRLRGDDGRVLRRYLIVIASAAKQSIVDSCAKIDCFAEPVIGLTEGDTGGGG